MSREDFTWGVGLENCWMAQRDRPGVRLLDVFLQMGHYERWQEDLELVRDLGVGVVRYSVPWYLSEPEPGRFDWEWISRSLEWLKKNRIVPIIDLIHYGTPTWMDNGVLNHSFPERLAAYAEAFSRQFAGVVDHFTPMNEPQASARLSGSDGVWPPYLHGIDGWMRLNIILARAVVLCTQALRASCPGSVLISADCDFTPPFAEVAAAAGMPAVVLDETGQFIHDAFAGVLAYGAVPPEHPTARAALKLGVPESELRWFAEHRALPDIVGLNHYPDLATFDCQTAGERLFGKLRMVHELLQLPVYLTETSGGRTEDEKVAWIGQLEALRERARAEGLPLRGVNWWPLYETIQWNYRDNGKSVAECIVPGGWNNGLYVSTGDLRRVPTKAVDAYRRVCGRMAG
jgi:beta-glucosidase